MKYFIYANKTDVKNPDIRERAIYFVPELKLRDWATKFDPGVMEFCGVSVEAGDKEEAKSIFLNPLDNDGFDRMISEDEPLLTRQKTRRFRQDNEVLNLTMELLTNRLAELWVQMDDLFWAMAQYYALQHKDVTEERAYRLIKNSWLNKYRQQSDT